MSRNEKIIALAIVLIALCFAGYRLAQKEPMQPTDLKVQVNP